MTTPGDEVLVDVDGHVATLTLNRPAQRNAVNPELALAMDAAMARVEADPGVWVVVLTGAGGLFSAGADLKAIAAGRALELSTETGGFAGFVRYPRTKPVIAAVTGFALAGGMELVLGCDLVVAADDATFGLPEVTRGIVAAGGGMFRLPRAIPPARARELLLLGSRLPAAEAHALGLVNRLVPADEVLDAARALAQEICANAPLAVRETLAVARAAADVDEQEAWRLSRAASLRVAQSEDAKEGPRAFAEKRPPTWTGR